MSMILQDLLSPLSAQERAALAEWCAAWQPFYITGGFNARIWQGRAILKACFLSAGANPATFQLYDSISNPPASQNPIATVTAAVWDGFVNASIKISNGLWVVNSQADATGELYFIPVPTV